MVTVLEQKSVDLGFNVNDALSVGLKPSDIDFNIKVTDIANDSIILHDLEVCAGNNVTATGRGHEDLALGSSFFHGGDFIAFKSGLKGVDRISFCDEDAGTHAAEGFAAAFSDVAVSCDDADFSSNHDVRSAFDSINQGFTAAVFR